MNKKSYTGVGSRKTPSTVLNLMTSLAEMLGDSGFILRSGGADGADSAFEHGSDKVDGSKQIFIPWGPSKINNGIWSMDSYRAGKSKEAKRLYGVAYGLAKSIHPAWSRCSDAAKLLHTRNIFQVLGPRLNNPSDFLICWTPNGEKKGGTRTAIVMAERTCVPIINLATDTRSKEDLISDLLNKTPSK